MYFDRFSLKNAQAGFVVHNSRFRTISVELCHRFTVMNEMNVFDQYEQGCHLYL